MLGSRRWEGIDQPAPPIPGLHSSTWSPLIDGLAYELRALESYGAKPAQVVKCPKTSAMVAARHPEESDARALQVLTVQAIKQACEGCPPAQRQSLLRLLRLSASASGTPNVNRWFAIRELKLHISVETFRRRNNRQALELYRVLAEQLLSPSTVNQSVEFLHRHVRHSLGSDGALLESYYIETVRSLITGPTRCDFSSEYPDDNSPEVIGVEAEHGCKIADEFEPTYPDRSQVTGSFALPSLAQGEVHSFEYSECFDTTAPMRPYVWETVGPLGTRTSTVVVEFPDSHLPQIAWSFAHVLMPLAIPSRPVGPLIKPFGNRIQYTFHEPTYLYGLAWSF